MINLLEAFKSEERFTKKSLGQHFLTNKHILEEIANALALEKNENVIEIGPGCGVLTQILLEKALKVKAVEIDNDLSEFLRRYLFFYPNFEVINEDALKANFDDIFSGEEVSFVGNLPYNLSVRIFERAAERKNVKSLVFMFQKEVADRINAKPCSKIYSSLSVFSTYLFDIKKIRDISGGNFYPNANVYSSVLKFVPKKDRAFEGKKEQDFFAFLRICFTQKRKTLKNNLKHLENIDEIIEKAGLKPTVRAEEISLEEFINLFKIAH